MRRDVGRGIVRGIFILLVVLLLAGVADAQLTDDAWSYKYHDINNSGKSPNIFNGNGSILYQIYNNSFFFTSPVVSDINGNFYGATENSPAKIFKFYPNLTIKWQTTSPDGIYASITLDEEVGNLYTMSYEGRVSGFSMNNGNLLWTDTSCVYNDGDIQIQLDKLGNLIYACDGYLYNRTSAGVLNWIIGSGNYYGTPAIDFDGNIYINYWRQYIDKIAPNQSILWTWNLGTASVIGDRGVLLDDSLNALYVTSRDTNKLYSIDSNTGLLKWEYLANSQLGTTPSKDSFGNIYFADSAQTYGYIHSIYPNNGSLRWLYMLPYGANSFKSRGQVIIDNENKIITIADDRWGIVGNTQKMIVVYNNGTEKMNITYVTNSSIADGSQPILTKNGNVVATWYNGIAVFDTQAPAPASFDPSGYVKDQGGNPLAGVSLVFGSSSTASNGTGWYDFGNIANATYSYTISRTGYETQTGSIDIQHGGSLKNWTLTPVIPGLVTISCPIGWCYAASDYSSKTLLELDNLFSTDTIQGHYNATSQKYESHRTGYNFNQNVVVSQKEGYYYYFSTATDITTTPGSTPSITLKQGWNLVGNYGSSARTLSALKTSIGASATQAKYYDKSIKTWVSSNSQNVPAMEAFMVYTTSQTNWGD